jgi:hypothetical protein
MSMVATDTTLQQCSIVPEPLHLGTPVRLDDTHMLKRRAPYKGHREQPAFWYSLVSGECILPNSKKGTLPENTTLATLLDKIEAYSIREYDSKKKSAVLYLVASKEQHVYTRAWMNRVDGDWKQVKGEPVINDDWSEPNLPHQ